MRNRFGGPLSKVAVAMLAVTPVILAQTQPQRPAIQAPADLSGIWGGAGVRYTLEDPPLQPWAMEIYRRNRRGLDPREQGLDELDPSTFCFPPGVTRAMVNNNFEIIQLPHKLVILFETSNGVRQIYLDGREHPEGWPFGWMGHSIGQWDGDTLVADTVGLNNRTWMDRGGIPHSDALHVMERFRRVNPDTLEIDFRFEDPKAFTRPWGAKKVYRALPGREILENIACEDYLRIKGDWRSEAYR